MFRWIERYHWFRKQKKQVWSEAVKWRRKLRRTRPLNHRHGSSGSLWLKSYRRTRRKRMRSLLSGICSTIMSRKAKQVVKRKQNKLLRNKQSPEKCNRRSQNSQMMTYKTLENKIKRWLQPQPRSSHLWRPSSHLKQCQLCMYSLRSLPCSRLHIARQVSCLCQDRLTLVRPNTLWTPKNQSKRSLKVPPELSQKTHSRLLSGNSKKRLRCLLSYQAEARSQSQRNSRAVPSKLCSGPSLLDRPPTRRTRSSAWRSWIVPREPSWCATQWSRSRVWPCSKDPSLRTAGTHGLSWVHRAREVPSLSWATTTDHRFPTPSWRRQMSWRERRSTGRATFLRRRCRGSQVCSRTRACRRSCSKRGKIVRKSARSRFAREIQSGTVLHERIIGKGNILLMTDDEWLFKIEKYLFDIL